MQDNVKIDDSPFEWGGTVQILWHNLNERKFRAARS